MLKYYSYYNVGGYKDMFLGDSSMNAEKTYFLPLLPVWKKKAAAGDNEMATKIETLEKLPPIKLVTSGESQGLPRRAKTLFSHGGYKAILTSSDSGETIFAIRDIESSSKDESGRSIPFLLVVVGSSENDKHFLEKVAVYASSHLETFSQKISSFFSYDSEKNGLAFALSKFTNYIRKIVEQSSNSLLTTRGEVVIESKMTDVPLLLVPEGISHSLALQEQGLSDKKVNVIDMIEVLPLDNPDKLIGLLKGLKVRRKSSLFSDKRVVFLLGGAAIVGFLIGFFIAK